MRVSVTFDFKQSHAIWLQLENLVGAPSVGPIDLKRLRVGGREGHHWTKRLRCACACLCVVSGRAKR